MPNLHTVLKDEISRIARKEINRQTATLKKQSAQFRRDIAALKRIVDEQKKEITFLRKQEKQRLASEPEASVGNGARFSPAWLEKHRVKLGISAADYAKLAGVSPLSIYKWERGETEPRDAQKAKLAVVRGMGKREALKRLEVLET